MLKARRGRLRCVVDKIARLVAGEHVGRRPRDGSVNGKPAQEKIVDQAKDRLCSSPIPERESDDSIDVNPRRFASWAQSKTLDHSYHSVRSAESGRHVWRGAQEQNRRPLQRA